MKTYKELQEEANKKARKELKVGLSMLTEGHHRMFKKMYSKMYSHEDLDADINNIVDSLPNDQIGWAMQQVKNSLIKMGLIK